MPRGKKDPSVKPRGVPLTTATMARIRAHEAKYAEKVPGFTINVTELVNRAIISLLDRFDETEALRRRK
jgi:hypothetical protein